MEETQNDDLSNQSREQLREALTSVQDATFDVLIKKPVRETAFFVHIRDDSGHAKPVRIRYKAMAPKAFDELVAAHPPTTKEERKGAQWNKDSFPQALVAAVSLVPKLTVEQANELLESDNWSSGESQQLFLNAINVCQSGLDVPFNAGD